MCRGGCYGCDGVSVVEDFVSGEYIGNQESQIYGSLAEIGDFVFVILNEVFSEYYGFYSGECLGFAGVDGFDPRMPMRASQCFAV